MDFLTPEVFNILIIANMIVGLVLIAYRFMVDMKRPIDNPAQQRAQQHDEQSTDTDADDAGHRAEEATRNKSQSGDKRS